MELAKRRVLVSWLWSRWNKKGLERSYGRDRVEELCRETEVRQEEGESRGLQRLCACFRAVSH